MRDSRIKRKCGGCGRPLIPGRTCEHILNPTEPTRRTDRTNNNEQRNER